MKTKSDFLDGKLSIYLSRLKVLVTQSCLILCNPMDCSPPGSSIHGIFQARILEWVAISFSSVYVCMYICIQASLEAQSVKNLPAMWDTCFQSLSWEDPLENTGYPLQYSGRVHAVTKSWTQLNNFHFYFHICLHMMRGERENYVAFLIL